MYERLYGPRSEARATEPTARVVAAASRGTPSACGTPAASAHRLDPALSRPMPVRSAAARFTARWNAERRSRLAAALALEKNDRAESGSATTPAARPSGRGRERGVRPGPARKRWLFAEGCCRRSCVPKMAAASASAARDPRREEAGPAAGRRWRSWAQFYGGAVRLARCGRRNAGHRAGGRVQDARTGDPGGAARHRGPGTRGDAAAAGGWLRSAAPRPAASQTWARCSSLSEARRRRPSRRRGARSSPRGAGEASDDRAVDAPRAAAGGPRRISRRSSSGRQRRRDRAGGGGFTTARTACPAAA